MSVNFAVPILERLFKLVREFKDIEDTRDLLRFEVEARGSAGVLSRIFGDKAADKANQLSNPLSDDDLNDYIISSEIIDDEHG